MRVLRAVGGTQPIVPALLCQLGDISRGYTACYAESVLLPAHRLWHVAAQALRAPLLGLRMLWLARLQLALGVSLGTGLVAVITQLGVRLFCTTLAWRITEQSTELDFSKGPCVHNSPGADARYFVV